MKATRHNGRSGKHGTYDAKHNDRRFDVENSEHTVDFSGYTACDENGKIDITPKELEILKVLIDNKGLVLSRNQILDDVWGYDCDVIDRTIDAYIRNIRKKLRLDCITTVKGIGYKFEMGQEI